jgi:hypothetical protein
VPSNSIELEPMPERESEVALAEVAGALDAQAGEVGAFPLGGRLRRGRGRKAGQVGGFGRGRFAAQKRGQIVPAAAQTGQIGLVEFAERGDDLLARPARGAHRPAQLPVTVTDATCRLGLSPQEHARQDRRNLAIPQRGVRHYIAPKRVLPS